MVETVHQAALTPVNDLRGGLPRDFSVIGTVWNVVVVRWLFVICDLRYWLPSSRPCWLTEQMMQPLQMLSELQHYGPLRKVSGNYMIYPKSAPMLNLGSLDPPCSLAPELKDLTPETDVPYIKYAVFHCPSRLPFTDGESPSRPIPLHQIEDSCRQPFPDRFGIRDHDAWPSRHRQFHRIKYFVRLSLGHTQKISAAYDRLDKRYWHGHESNMPDNFDPRCKSLWNCWFFYLANSDQFGACCIWIVWCENSHNFLVLVEFWIIPSFIGL